VGAALDFNSVDVVKWSLSKVQGFLIAGRQVAFAKLLILSSNIQRNWTLPTRRSR